MAEAQQTARRSWHTALTSCFRNCYRIADTQNALLQLHRQHALPGLTLAQLLVTLESPCELSPDPLLTSYLLCFIDNRLITTTDILEAISRFTTLSVPSQSDSTDKRTIIGPSKLEAIFDLLSRCFLHGNLPSIPRDATRLVISLHRTLAQSTKPDSGWSDVIRQGPKAGSLCEQLAVLSVNILENQLVRKALDQSLNAGARASLLATLNSFITATTHVAPASPALPRLSVLAKSAPLFRITRATIKAMTSPQITSIVNDLPVGASRAGLYIYISAMLTCGPLVDDLSMFRHLIARYGTATQSLIIDLIVATFDAYSNALYRNHNQQSVFCHKTFIANKLPLLILSLSTEMYQPNNTETAVRLALARLDVFTFNPLTVDPMGLHDVLRGSRQDFIMSCYQHRLVTFQCALEATGIQPKAVTCSSEGLMAACANNTRRVEELIAQLDRLDGHAASVAAALCRIVADYCASKDAPSLKIVALALLRHLPLLDVVLQHISVDTFIGPLCTHINTWAHDQDQSEFQPAYEEFSAVLLLILATARRYGLQAKDMKLGSDSTFLYKFMTQGLESIPVEDMTVEQSKHLSMWVKGMFSIDEQGESSGISDEVLSQSSPMDFYLLVPTLFDQSLLACHNKTLTIKTLLGGLEFLLEPFLLPSLFSVFTWIGDQAWLRRNDREIMIEFVNKLMIPPSISGDAKVMHDAIMLMVDKQISTVIMRLGPRGTGHDKLDQLPGELRLKSEEQRRSGTSPRDLAAWSSQNGSWRQVVRTLVAQMTVWVSQGDLSPTPVSFDHRAFASATDLLGAESVLLALVDEIVNQTAVGLGSAALEVSTALVCAPFCCQPSPSSPTAPDATNSLTRHPDAFRRALKDFTNNKQRLLQTEPRRFEALIRLARLVEAQSAISPTSHMQPTLVVLANAVSLPPLDMIAASATSVTADDALIQSAISMTSGGASSADFAIMDVTTAADIVAAATSTDVPASSTTLQLDLPDNLFDTSQAMDFSLESLQNAPLADEAVRPMTADTALGADILVVDSMTGQTVPGLEALGTGGDDDIFAGLDFGGLGEDDFSL